MTPHGSEEADDLVAVYQPTDMSRQVSVESLLREQGIPSVLRHTDALAYQGGSPAGFGSPLQPPQILVAAQDAVSAKELIDLWATEAESLDTPSELQNDQSEDEPPPPPAVTPSNFSAVPILLIAAIIASIVGYLRGMPGWLAVIAAGIAWIGIYVWMVFPRK